MIQKCKNCAWYTGKHTKRGRPKEKWAKLCDQYKNYKQLNLFEDVPKAN